MMTVPPSISSPQYRSRLLLSVQRGVEQVYGGGSICSMVEVPGGRIHYIFRIGIRGEREEVAVRVRRPVFNTMLPERPTESYLKPSSHSLYAIPEIIAHGLLDCGAHFTMQKWIKGVRGDCLRMSPVLAWKLGEILASVHHCCGAGFSDSMELAAGKGEAENWSDLFYALLQQECRLLEKIMPTLVQTVQSNMRSIMDDVLDPPEPVLTHSDFHLRNLIEQRGKFFIIDWDRAAYRHPHIDFVKPFSYNFRNPMLRNSFVEGYNSSGSTPAPQSGTELRPYELLWRMKMIRFEYLHPVRERYFFNWSEHREQLLKLYR